MCVFLFKFHIWLIYLFGICAKFQNIWFVLKMYCHLSEYDMQTSQILDFTLLYRSSNFSSYAQAITLIICSTFDFPPWSQIVWP